MEQSVYEAKRIALIGVPSSAGARQVGQELTPNCLRASGLVERLRSGGHDLLDLGDLTEVSFSPDTRNTKKQNLPLVLGVLRQVASAVDLAVSNRAWPLVVGGDCTVTIGVLAGLAKHFSSFGMIYFDGDVDLNTPETTTSGIFDGMGLAHIIGQGVDELSHFGPRYPLLDQRNVTLFGYSLEAGGIDPVEVKLLQDTLMAKYPLEGIEGRVQTAAALALRELEGKVEHILVHFDVDVVDFDDFPAADVPHKPGLSLMKAKEALAVFLASPKAVGLVLTEFNAKRDSEAKLARRLIDTMVGAIMPGKSSRYDDGLEKRRAADTWARRSPEGNMDSVLDYADANEALHLAQLGELLSIPSVSTEAKHRQDVRRCADWLARHLQSIGMQNSRIFATGGHPIVYSEWSGRMARATLLVYGHYDVQPAEPADAWTSAAFEAAVRNGRLYARGATDNKGQLFIHLKAIESYLRTLGELPLNLKLILEGEEETGSEHLEGFMNGNHDLLIADVACISDTAFFAKEVPSICHRMRGNVYMQIEISGANRDLHSGAFGGSLHNPIQVLSELIAQLHDASGRVAVPGFYDAVQLPGDEERMIYRRLPWSDEEYAQGLGVGCLFGEAGFTTLERLWVRPTLECCGIWGGFAGEGVKTVLPAKASAKISMRLVPDQESKEIASLFQRHIQAITPKGVQVCMQCLATSEPAMTPIQGPGMRAALAALERSFRKTPVLQGEGGTLPVIALLKRILGIDAVLLGFGVPDENAHAPDEFLDLDLFHGGVRTTIHFYSNLAKELAKGEQRGS